MSHIEHLWFIEKMLVWHSVHLLLLQLTASILQLQTFRYLRTHYNSWNPQFFRLWKSVEAVRYRHNCASKKGYKHGLGRISQMDMGLTQLGFFGMVLMQGPKVGVHSAKKEDFEGMLHVWKVIGHVLGVDERWEENAKYGFSIIV